MKKWIRWQGLGVFLVVVIVFSILWFLVIDDVVEAMIEKFGTQAVGAKVELESADLTLFPVGLQLIRLKVTNPDEPMTNAVEIARIDLSLDTLNLLRQKIIIDEMSLDGVQVNTTRKSSGAVRRRRPAAPPRVSKKAPKKGLCAAIELPTFTIPNVTEILNNEKLQSLELVESVQTDIENTKKRWQKKLQELPDKAKFDEYRSRIEQLKSKRRGTLGGLLGAAGDVANLKKDLERDLDRLKHARQGFNRKTTSLKTQLDQTKQAPLKDVKHLKDKYSLSPRGLSNLSSLLFGYRLCGWMQKAMGWYEKVKPVLERAKKKEKGHEVVEPMRGKGVNVRFKEYAPLPDFLIRNAKVGLKLRSGNLTGAMENITPDQDILGLPLTFKFSGQNMERLNAITIDGSLDHTSPARPKDTVNANVKGYKVQDVTLSNKPKWPVTLKGALVDLDTRALLKGEDISANLDAGLTSVRLSAGLPDGAGPLAKAMASALSDISQFTVEADVAGTIEDYDIHLTSDLDRVLKDAAGNAVRKQAAGLEKELEKAIFAKVGGPLEQAKTSLGGLDAIASELTRRQNLGNGLLKDLKLRF